ncbi:MAG: T9SS type A sorting domain-containing protein [Bacteroidia bacterium]
MFIGRQPDVGIDEACMWYQLPNTTTPIDTVAGMWVKPNVTTSYLVRQEICGNVKWDLVTVYISAVGLPYQNGGSSEVENQLTIYPQPAKDALNLSFEIAQANDFKTIGIYNSLGQLVKEEEITFSNTKASININDLPAGIYLLKLSKGHFNTLNVHISKRFVIDK